MRMQASCALAKYRAHSLREAPPSEKRKRSTRNHAAFPDGESAFSDDFAQANRSETPSEISKDALPRQDEIRACSPSRSKGLVIDSAAMTTAPARNIRTRFAPSPTGFLHIGGARTALFSWAFARRHGGTFVLRIEDTDQERSTRESEAAVLDGLQWLELDWDEGPFRQSERGDLYRAAVEKLLATGRAYRCICTKEELEERKQRTIEAGQKWTYDGKCRNANHGPSAGTSTVRLRLDEATPLTWNDLVFGPSGQATEEVGDRIIQRSDGSPLYHLAVVVDDIEMRITHVIRGVDHQVNTAFQLALYHALGATPPEFAHVPLIVGTDGKKLSKRRDPVSVQHYRDAGYLPAATRNWLLRLGWSHGDQEIFSRHEIVQLFDLESISRSPAQADLGKLPWLSQQYLKALPMPELFQALQPFYRRSLGRELPRTHDLEKILDLLRDRSHTLAEMVEMSLFVVHDNISFEPKAAQKYFTREIEAPFAALRDRYAALESWDIASLEREFEVVLAENAGEGKAAKLGKGKLAQPIRVAITGTDKSPGIFETLELLGQERSLHRMAEALHFIRHGS